MQETIAINGLTLCHKHSDGWVRSTMPDVCKSPDKPIPYTNTAYARDLAKGTTTVFSHGGAMNGVKGSEFYRSFGDEPGVGGGIVSGVNKDRATFLSWSPNVFMEGRNVTRLTDRMLLNKGNTISAGGYYTGPVKGPQREILEKICEFACACKAAGTFSQRCIDGKILEWASQAGRNVTPGGAYEIGEDGKWAYRLDDGGNQLRGGPKGTKMPDYTDHDNNSFGENKLPKDRYRGNQNETYDEIGQDTDQDRNDINFKKDCKCDDDDDGNRAPVTQPAPQTERETEPSNNGSWFSRNAGWLVPLGVGAVAVGAILLAPETGGASLAALAL